MNSHGDPSSEIKQHDRGKVGIITLNVLSARSLRLCVYVLSSRNYLLHGAEEPTHALMIISNWCDAEEPAHALT